MSNLGAGWILLWLVSHTAAMVQDWPGADSEKIQSTWQAVSIEDSGRKASPDVIQNVRWIVTKTGITYKAGNLTTELVYELDPTRNPKWIDLRVVGEEKDKAPTLGIYELEGDSLKVCFSDGVTREKRPTAFESMPDSPNDVFFLFKRVEP